MKTYAEAAAFLGGRKYRTIPSIRSTSVERTDEDTIVVRYHGTNVVTYYSDGTCMLLTHGYHTVTTKARINDFSPARVYQKNYEWFIFCPNDYHERFVEGMVIGPNGQPTHDESERM
jgi:hypothetical protein